MQDIDVVMGMVQEVHRKKRGQEHKIDWTITSKTSADGRCEVCGESTKVRLE